MTATPHSQREEWYDTPASMKHAPHPLQEQFDRMEQHLKNLKSLDSKHRGHIETLKKGMSKLREGSTDLSMDVATFTTINSTLSPADNQTETDTTASPEKQPKTPASASQPTKHHVMKTISSPELLPFTLQPPPPEAMFNGMVRELPTTPTRKGKSTTSSIAAGFWKGLWTPEKVDQASQSSSPDLLSPGKTHFRVAGQETESTPVPLGFKFRSNNPSVQSSPSSPEPPCRDTNLLDIDTTVPLKINFPPQHPAVKKKPLDVTIQASTTIGTAQIQSKSAHRPRLYGQPGRGLPDTAFNVDIQPGQAKNLKRFSARPSQYTWDISEVKPRPATRTTLWEPFPDFNREGANNELTNEAWQKSVVGKAEIDKQKGSLSTFQHADEDEGGDVGLVKLYM